MEFIEKYGHKTNNFTLKIMNNSPYIEGNTKKIVNIGFKDICEIIIGDTVKLVGTLGSNNLDFGGAVVDNAQIDGGTF